jgi:death-on-curing family protein
MIEVKKNIQYLDRFTVEYIHKILSNLFKDEEPLPPFSTANDDCLDSLIKIPQSRFFGVEQYPTIESKAAIIFYTLNKKHLFLNGNKRMSVGCMLAFLAINHVDPIVKPDELTEKALWLAKTTQDHSFHETKRELESWIKEKVIGA